jgi:hypothetical protein
MRDQKLIAEEDTPKISFKECLDSCVRRYMLREPKYEILYDLYQYISKCDKLEAYYEVIKDTRPDKRVGNIWHMDGRIRTAVVKPDFVALTAMQFGRRRITNFNNLVRPTAFIFTTANSYCFKSVGGGRVYDINDASNTAFVYDLVDFEVCHYALRNTDINNRVEWKNATAANLAVNFAVKGYVEVGLTHFPFYYPNTIANVHPSCAAIDSNGHYVYFKEDGTTVNVIQNRNIFRAAKQKDTGKKIFIWHGIASAPVVKQTGIILAPEGFSGKNLITLEEYRVFSLIHLKLLLSIEHRFPSEKKKIRNFLGGNIINFNLVETYISCANDVISLNKVGKFYLEKFIKPTDYDDATKVSAIATRLNLLYRGWSRTCISFLRNFDNLQINVQHPANHFSHYKDKKKFPALNYNPSEYQVTDIENMLKTTDKTKLLFMISTYKKDMIRKISYSAIGRPYYYVGGQPAILVLNNGIPPSISRFSKVSKKIFAKFNTAIVGDKLDFNRNQSPEPSIMSNSAESIYSFVRSIVNFAGEEVPEEYTPENYELLQASLIRMTRYSYRKKRKIRGKITLGAFVYANSPAIPIVSLVKPQKASQYFEIRLGIRFWIHVNVLEDYFGLAPLSKMNEKKWLSIKYY